MPKRPSKTSLEFHTKWPMVYLGIDPGQSGSIATLSEDRGCCWKMPETEQDIWRLIKNLGDYPNPKMAVIEQVCGMPGQNSAAMFKFAGSYYGLRMALIAARIPFESKVPRAWQKTFGVSPRKKTEEKSVFKNRLKAKAQELFPHNNLTLATCDALLIAEYCRRKHEGKL